MEIIKTYKQTILPTKFVGFKYGDADREHGGFGHKWGEWFETKRFAKLESLITDEFRSKYEEHDSYVGLMRCSEEKPFEYWIGMFLPAHSSVPDGFEHVSFDTSNLGVCWVYGNEHEIYCQEDICASKLEEVGYSTVSIHDAFWCFERYVCPRFTTSDDQGKVILDVGWFIQ